MFVSWSKTPRMQRGFLMRPDVVSRAKPAPAIHRDRLRERLPGPCRKWCAPVIQLGEEYSGRGSRVPEFPIAAAVSRERHTTFLVGQDKFWWIGRRRRVIAHEQSKHRPSWM